MKCSNCGKVGANDARYCAGCGASMPIKVHGKPSFWRSPTAAALGVGAASMVLFAIVIRNQPDAPPHAKRAETVQKIQSKPTISVPVQTEQSGPSDAQLMSAAMEIVKARLKDPGSAEFSDFYLSRKSGTPVMCGYVNSKNGFGGMTGRQRFIGGGVAGLEEDFAPGEMDAAWAKMC